MRARQAARCSGRGLPETRLCAFWWAAGWLLLGRAVLPFCPGQGLSGRIRKVGERLLFAEPGTGAHRPSLLAAGPAAQRGVTRLNPGRGDVGRQAPAALRPALVGGGRNGPQERGSAGAMGAAPPEGGTSPARSRGPNGQPRLLSGADALPGEADGRLSAAVPCGRLSVQIKSDGRVGALAGVTEPAR